MQKYLNLHLFVIIKAMKVTWKNLLKIALGNLLVALSTVYLILPSKILAGGSSGVGLIFSYLFDFDPVWVIDITVIVAFILGYIFLDRKVIINSLLSTILFPLFSTILKYFPYRIEANPILLTVFGGVLTGVGMGLAIQADASSGGVDIFAFIIAKYTKLPVEVTLALVDGIIIICGVATSNIENVMLGLIYVYVYNLMIKKMISYNGNPTYSVYIISEHYQEILDYVHNNLGRGSTILQGRGGYTGNEKSVILVVISLNQYNELCQKVETIDPNAFIIVNDSKEVRGEGFTYDYRI